MRLLRNPAFTLNYKFDAGTPGVETEFRLEPSDPPERLFDMRREQSVDHDPIHAFVVWVPAHGWWVVCTGVGHAFGDRRYRRVPTQAEAEMRLVKWFSNRFRLIAEE